MMKKTLITFISSVLLLTIPGATAVAETGTLPGGTAVSLEIVSPEDGAEISANGETGTVTLTGSASIGIGQASADTTLIFLLDASGSTEESSGLALSCPDQNPIDVDPGDPNPDENDIIDCEIGAAIALNQQAIELGTIDEVAMIIFAGDAVAADGTPSTIDDPLISPAADQNQNGEHDVTEILQSIQVAFLFGHESGFSLFNPKDTPDIVKTDYADALSRAGEVAAQASNENVIIMMISDGVNNAGGHVSSALPINIPGKSVTINTFAIPDSAGVGGTCTSDRDFLGSLQEIVDLQNSINSQANGSCYQVSDPSTLPNLLPEVIVPTIDNISIQVNGGPDVPIPNADLTASLPQPGPVDVGFETAVADLPPGEHEICVNVTGSDAGGSGTLSDCVTVTVTSGMADLAIHSPLGAVASLEPSVSTEYQFTIENYGPSTATNVVFSQFVPDDISMINIDPEKGGCFEDIGLVSCEIGELLVNESVTVAVQAATNCTNGSMLEATVLGAEDDPLLENNTAVISTAQALIDHGDAPIAQYNDATHCDFSMEWLGLVADGEFGPNDNDASDDGFASMQSGYPYQRLRATISTSGLGELRYGTAPDERLYLSIWVDYNQDGDWDDEGEQAVFCDVAPGTLGQCNGHPTNWRPSHQDSFTFQIRFRLRNEIPDQTWVRARLTYGEPVGPTGFAEYGEVEDFTADLFIR
ncbi:MAG: GEVED domain-containing protein [Chloroflexota bacterium]